MITRIPGSIGLFLGQLPPGAPPSAGEVHRTPARHGPARELAARAVVHAKGTIATKGYHCRRGETLTFDGSQSSANANEFEWTFFADDVPVAREGFYSGENLPAGERFDGKKTGRTVSVVALESFTALLVVSDGHTESMPFRIDVRVESRPWQTEFFLQKMEKTFTEFCMTTGHHAGSNMCSLCPSDEVSGHMIHHDLKRADWMENFRVVKVEDPGGLFDGLFYVEKLKLRIDRTIYINSALTTGHVYQLNLKKGTKANQEGLKARVECTRQHEKLHADLIQQVLRKTGMDPAPRVEMLIGIDEATLASRANSEVAVKEDILISGTERKEGHSALRQRLQSMLKTTKVKFLLPRNRADEAGVETEVDLLSFED